jgi:hypothetical protein
MTSRRRILIALGLTAGLPVALYLIALVRVIRAAHDDQRRPADAIVVLGAAQYNGRPSPVLRARLLHSLALYIEGYAPVVVVTGGAAPGDAVSEAEARRHGVVAWTTPSPTSPIAGPREWSYFLAEGVKYPVALLRDDGSEWPGVDSLAR